MSSAGRSRPAGAPGRRSRAGGRDADGRGPRRDAAPREASGSRERLREVIAPVVTAAGYDLEDVSVSRAGRRHVVRVLVDGDGGVSLDDVAEVSRAVSAALDSAEESGGELIAGEYQLEVGSPGVDRPLTLPRHWRRNLGRLVKVRVADTDGGGRQATGRVLGADDEGIVLDVDGTAHELAYGRLGPGRVQVEFSRLADLPDADADDADDPDADDDEELEDEER